MIAKITEQHRRRAAYIYIRQSTMGQVRHHQESTQRQYALKDKVLALGWEENQIRVLDRDLGQSGAQTSGREDFKTLVADVSMGQVGAVVALEASRLARSSADWHRLIEICGLTATVLMDEDGCYDPADFNDGLLLGLKGTMSQAELHFIRARLEGGRRNKATRGALRLPLPVGLCHGDEGRTTVDPDEQVQGAVRLLLGTFHRTGSAYAVMQHFARQGLKFPKRLRGGPTPGKLVWGPLGHARVLAVLRNPAYSGTYVFGRYRMAKELLADGQVAACRKLTPLASWLVTIQDHHAGYLSWQQYLQHQELLARNRTHGSRTMLSGPSREGRALLQGLLLCRACGGRVGVRYAGEGGRYARYECDNAKRGGLAQKPCLALSSGVVDEVVSKRALEVLEPAQIELAIEAASQLERRDEAVLKQWRMRIEQAEYDARLAERRYEEVDPSNRLVAGTLETRWEEALHKLEELQRQREELLGTQTRVVTPEQRARVLALAQDLPRLWNAPSTSARDRKRMLRLLIEDITVEPDPQRRAVVLHLRWRGGVCEDIPVDLPPEKIRTSSVLLNRIRELTPTARDAQIASILNEEGLRTARGKPFTRARVWTIRRGQEVAAAAGRTYGELSVAEVAARLAVTNRQVRDWLALGKLEARTVGPNKRRWICLTAENEARLRAELAETPALSPESATIESGAE